MPSVSHICQAYPDRVEVRGRDLTGDLMGRLSFTDYFHLLLTGAEPTDDQRFFLDLLLVAIAEHGLMPTNVAARMTLASDPNSLQGAVAAGILGAGPVLLGTTEECARLLDSTRTSGEDPKDVAQRMRDAGEKLPGFGHPVHKPLDPRAERILELAHERGIAAEYVALAEAFRGAVHEAWGRPLTMNLSMPMAAVLLDLGFPSSVVKAVPILARTAGLLGHLAEEQQEPIGFALAKAAEERAEYRADARSPLGRATGDRRRELRGAPRLSARTLAFLCRPDPRKRPARAHPRAPAHHEAGAARDRDRRGPVRRPLHRGRPCPHLLDERHDRHSQLHPADRH